MKYEVIIPISFDIGLHLFFNFSCRYLFNVENILKTVTLKCKKNENFSKSFNFIEDRKRFLMKYCL